MNTEILPPGALPVVDPDFRFPVLSFRDDGKSVLRHDPGRLLLQTFTLAARDRDSLSGRVLDRIRALCLAAGFPGRAIVFVSKDHVVSSVGGVECSVELAIWYTWDRDADMPGLRASVLSCDIPGEIGDDAFAEADLLKLSDAFIVMSVMSA